MTQESSENVRAATTTGSGPSWLWCGLDGIRAAVSFLTVLPAGQRKASATAGYLNRAVAWFPLVGAGIGGVGAAVLAGADTIGLGPPLAALLGVAATVVLTGALHEDGLADVADGLGGGWTREERLRIMRDSRIGTFGALAAVCALAARVGALAALDTASAGAVALIIAGAASRAPVAAVMRWSPPARRDGAAATAGRVGFTGVAFAAATATALAFALLDAAAAAATLAAAALAAAAMTALAHRSIGGHTGDVLGAGQQLSEVAVLLTLVALR